MMPSNQSYSTQREQLMQLKHFLQQFDNEMQQKLSEYKQRIANLREAGLPIETAEKFNSEIILETENCIRKNSDYIKSDVIPLLNKNIGILDRLANEPSTLSQIKDTFTTGFNSQPSVLAQTTAASVMPHGANDDIIDFAAQLMQGTANAGMIVAKELMQGAYDNLTTDAQKAYDKFQSLPRDNETGEIAG
jgi:hypothetical protein